MNQTRFHQRAERIADELRSAIVEHRYKPGERIPTRNELTAHYGVSKVTVQRALQELTDEGFLLPCGTRGTFVAHTSPHLTRYYLLLPQTAETGRVNQIWYALKREAEAMQGGARFVFHHDQPGRKGFAEYEQMLDDVSSKRVAGIIFAQAPFVYRDTPLLTQAGVPRAAIASRPYNQDIPVVAHDYDSFLELSLQQLQDAGCRRPAMLMVGGMMRLLSAGGMEEQFRAHGMSTPRHWLQTADVSNLDAIGNLVQLLFDYPAAQRPDSLIIANDNFVEPVTQALKALGLRVPDDLQIIAETNFPYPTPAHLPVCRIGFSVTECLRLCMQIIDMQQRGEQPPMQQMLPAIHDTLADPFIPN